MPRPRAPHDPPPPGPMLAGPDPAPPASQRKRTKLRRGVYALAAPLLFALARGLWATCRVRVVEGEELLETTLRGHPTCVPTFWHEQLIGGAIFLVDTLRVRKRELAFLVSPSVDGDLVTSIVERAGGRVVRGSATRSGVKSLRDLYRLMRKHSASPLFTPDGPVGPPRKCKLGAILLAQLSGTPVLPIALVPRQAWRLSTWDRLQVPLPFTRVEVAFGAPVSVPAEATTEELEPLRVALEAELERLRRRVDARP